MKHGPNAGARLARSRCGLLLLCLLVPAAAQAQYVVTEGKGYVLCERLAAHVNRLTENGKAKRLWRFLIRKEMGQLIPYPEKQAYLARELLSFAGFKRPPFSEIKLDDIRALLELMGEVDALGVRSAPYYLNDSAGIDRYISDRKAGTVPAQVLDDLAPQGQRFYQRLEQGKARVFSLTGGDSPESRGTLLQIEYADYNGEPLALLRRVSDDLDEPWPRNSSFDFYLPSRHLVLWHGVYYTITGDTFGFGVETQTQGRYPHLCRFTNGYHPPETP